MMEIFDKGAQKIYEVKVVEADIAAFAGATVHELYSTFAAARDAEWTGRLFVLAMKENTEEGIGTFVHIKHHAPAFLGETIEWVGIFDHITEKQEIIVQVEARVGDRLIASGSTGQKIFDRKRLEEIINTKRNSATK